MLPVISSTQRMDPLGFRSVDFAEWLKSDGIMIHTAKNWGDHRHHTGERCKQAVAMKDCDIVELNFDEFIAHLQSNRPAFLLFFSNVTQHLSSAYEEVQTLSFSSTMGRLVRTLTRLADEFGVPEPVG